MSTRMMMASRRLGIAATLGMGLTMALSSVSAEAACTPDPADAGGSATCGGASEAYSAFNDGVTVTVLPGATVFGANQPAIQMGGDDQSFINRGQVDGTASFWATVVLSGERSTGINHASITQSYFAPALRLNDRARGFENTATGSIISTNSVGIDVSEFLGTIDNDGLISAGTSGIYLSSGSGFTLAGMAIVNGPTGIIEGGTGGITSVGSQSARVENAGIIRSASSTGYGAMLGEAITLVNLEGGTVQATDGFALYSSAARSYGTATFINHGLIEADNAAVSGFSYILQNFADVSGSVTGTYASIYNLGTIDGDITLENGDDMVENRGTITGNVSMGAGSDVYRDFGGQVDGGVSLGTGDDFYMVDPTIAPGAIAGAIDGGGGRDASGVSITDVRSVTPELAEGFEMYAIDTRTPDAAALITTADPFEHTVAAFGYGTVTNDGVISTVDVEAVRLITSDIRNHWYQPPFDTGAFSENSHLVNNGTIAASGAAAITTQGVGDDFVINNGEIVGNVLLGAGSDIFVNRGSVDGDVDLGEGENFYFVDAGGATLTGSVSAGTAFDSAGFYADGIASGQLALVDGFERSAVFVDGEDASFTILAGAPDQAGFYIALLGDGTVVNQADLSDGQNQLPTVTLLGDGVTFRNEGNIDGYIGVEMQGNGQTFVNDADISRESSVADNTGLGGFVRDVGLGNTIINNASITSTAFGASGVFIGETSERTDMLEEAIARLQLADEPIPVTTLVNNGVITGRDFGVQIETPAPVELTNAGHIGGIYTRLMRYDVTIVNQDGATIDGDIGLLIDLDIFPTRVDGDRVTDGEQAESIDVGVHVVNETGASIAGGIIVGGATYGSDTAYLAHDTRVGVTIENQAGAVITADEFGSAVLAVPEYEPLTLSTQYPGSTTLYTDVSNAGTISGTVRAGEEVDFTLSNSGLVESGGTTVTLVSEDKVINRGTIDGATAIKADTRNAISNTGTISGGTGIEAGNENDIFNDGVIDVTVTGISATSDHSGDFDSDGNSGIVNKGTILSDGRGISVGNGNYILNDGEIHAGTIGVAMNGGQPSPSGLAFNVLTNEGTITGGDIAVFVGQGQQIIINTGDLAGPVAIAGANQKEDIVNSGVITGDLNLGGGDDAVRQLGGTIQGDINAGAGIDYFAVYGGSSFNGSLSGLELLSTNADLVDGNFTGNAGAGKTSVENGTLRVTGALSTATLTGAGTVQSNVSNGELVTPGMAIGTLTIDGGYTQTADGALLIELNTTQSDKLVVTGAAVLDGVVIAAVQAGDLSSLAGRSYTVLTAEGGVTGALDTLGSVEQGFLTLDIVQSANAVVLTITDVNVPIGAMEPRTGALNAALREAAENAPEQASPVAGPTTGGVVISAPDPGDDGDDGGIEITNAGLPPLDPGVITGPDDQQQSTSLSYDSMGDWESAAASFTGDWNTLGDRTPAGAMPKTGSGTFEGTTRGELTETASGAPEAFVVEGNVLLTANFASGLVNADFTGMEKIDADGVASAWVDFRARMSIADGTSEFAGTAGTGDGVWNGEAKGGFFGDEGGMPGHAAGLWSMSSPLGRALGGFTAKRQ